MVMVGKKPTGTTSTQSVSGGSSSGSGGAGPLWTKAGTEITRRVAFVQIYGETGTGRSSLALSAPGPIALMHADEKLDGIVEPFTSKGKDVQLHNFGGTFSGSTEQIAQQANAAYMKFMEAWNDAFRWARTIVLDTHTELWELLRLARFGKLAQVKPIHYGPVNAEWQSIFKAFRRQDRCNLICIGKIRERYVNDKPTGVMEQAGQKEFNYLGDIRVRMDKDVVDGGLSFTGTIEKGWFNAAAEGIELTDDQLEWGQLLELVTEIPAEEWQ